jgi:hypothetical protein
MRISHGRLRNGTSAAEQCVLNELNSVHKRPWSLSGITYQPARCAAHGSKVDECTPPSMAHPKATSRVRYLAAVQGLIAHDEADVLARCRRLRADKQQRCRELATYIANCIKVQ